MFDAIKNNSYIINQYNKVKEYEDKDPNAHACHSMSHVLNVVNTIEEVLKELNYDNDYIEEAKIAALLHDLGCYIGKENHTQRSYEMAKEFFKINNIKLKYEDEVLSSIRNHSDGFDSNSMMTLALVFADKIDIKNNRVANAGRSILGVRQFLNIDDIIVDIINDKLIVKFIMNENINRKELEEYYFIPKVFKSIDIFAKKISRTSNILWNDVEWILENNNI